MRSINENRGTHEESALKSRILMSYFSHHKSIVLFIENEKSVNLIIEL